MTIKTITEMQEFALANPILLGIESLRPRYKSRRGDHSLILTVNAGYE